jgi:hypothetical protein
VARGNIGIAGEFLLAHSAAMTPGSQVHFNGGGRLVELHLCDSVSGHVHDRIFVRI